MKLVIASLLTAFMMTAAYPHDWYPRDCCSDDDCAPVPAGLVEVTSKGYLIKPHRELGEPFLMEFGDPRIRPSQDAQMHACIIPGVYGAAMVRCLFVSTGV